MQLVIFYIFAAVLLFSATMVITTRNPVHSALFLVLAFFNAAAIWLLAEAEFLGIVLVVVYVGAVMVLFLFVVMMLDINVAPLREGFARYLPLGAAVALVMLAQMVLVVSSDQIQLIGAEGAPGGLGENTRILGGVLYTTYVYPFELASIVLLVAIVATIMLTLRRRPGTKHQNPAHQVRVRKADRLRIVEMPAEQRIARVEEEK
ncbi:MAG TPA: NADH-quinone oxidoreductase subunit J [Gammaproteobacteria bacterium]|nr:NADH-quinone oxidoreductase subunit J [Gammaproteobacteria bacterium]